MLKGQFLGEEHEEDSPSSPHVDRLVIRQAQYHLRPHIPRSSYELQSHHFLINSSLNRPK